ncbi:hypothetical protein E2C01_041841 [Portunus trituberculatus]|uniref:Uncharacterized protein n=1 Tax=Portunus trituberculatus TaxID=210409 RepID=A0A5B7FRG3_PORTR|nr:hypothetical protein [Portunus trituberculatus]
MEWVSEDHLFYNSMTENPLLPRSLARLHYRMIESADLGRADLGHATCAHNIRSLAASLAFLRTPLGGAMRSYGDSSTSLTSGDKKWITTE